MRKYIFKKIQKYNKLLIYLKSNWRELKLLLSSKSLLPWNNPIKDQIPWITFEAKKWLEKYLKPDMIVFEYGSGGSTLFFQKLVKKIISIEHDRIWYKKMLKYLKKKDIFFNSYFLIEPEKSIKRNKNKKKDNSLSTLKVYSNMSFKKYVNSIDKYPQKYFDVIFIDGRDRNSCVKKSISKIRQDGIIILDNSERERYQESISLLSKYKRIDFYGFGPYRYHPWQTSVWFINSSD